MKMFIKLITMAGLGALLMTGCSNKDLDVDAHVKNEQMANELDGAPKWVMSYGENEDMIYGIGIAEPSYGDIAFQKTVAMASGRDEISRIIGTKVKNMLKSYKEKTGTTSGTFDKVTSDVSKQVSHQILNGSKRESWWISRSGNLYVLVSIPKANVKEMIKEATNSSFRNNEAMWQKFQSKQAQDELEATIQSQL